MKMYAVAVFAMCIAAAAADHGPVFGLATPTNSKGEWSVDVGTFGRTSTAGSQVSIRGLVGYGFTPHVTLSFSAPAIVSHALLPPTRIQPSSDFESTLAWRFQHNTTKVGTRIESTAFAGLVVPGAQANFGRVVSSTNIPGNMIGAVTGLASRSHYVWVGATYTKFYERRGDRRPDVLEYSLVYGYRPLGWRRDIHKWDWRFFGELVGERSPRFLQTGAIVPETQAHQVFLGPSMLGIFKNYTISFGAQVPIYRDVGTLFPHERVRYAINFAYLLFSHSHSE
jgi:hypothetical protein